MFSMYLKGDRTASLYLKGDRTASLYLKGDRTASLYLKRDRTASLNLLGTMAYVLVQSSIPTSNICFKSSFKILFKDVKILCSLVL
jgi:hypothetical protein